MGETKSLYCADKVNSTRSAHGYRTQMITHELHKIRDRHTRTSYSHCSSPLSSWFIHSSTSISHFSRSFGVSGMNLVTSNRTAPSTKSLDKTGCTVSSLSRSAQECHTILVRSAIPAYGSPLLKALTEKDHSLDEHPNRENGIWGIWVSF